jgi:regulator of cell morphogenesis and NO signaling
MQPEPSSLISELAASLPGAVAVLERHGIGGFCQGDRTLEAACHERGLALDEILRQLRELSPDLLAGTDWSTAPLSELMRHIVAFFHGNLRRDLPALRNLASKVRDRHGADRPELRQIEDHLEALEEEITFHAVKEEEVLFPMIERLENGGDPRQVFGGSLQGPIRAMEEEHQEVASRLEALRSITSGYSVPGEACAGFRALYQGLAALESETHQHIHLENDILFPRAEALARSAEAR